MKLEACVTPGDLSQSQIGAVFIDHVRKPLLLLLLLLLLSLLVRNQI